MFDGLQKFLSEQGTRTKEEEEEFFDWLWDEKADFIRHICFEYGKHLDALLGEGKYKDNLKELQRKTEELEREPTETGSPQKDSSKVSSWVDDDILIEVFKLFFSRDYSAPVDPVELQLHLHCLFVFYNYMVKVMPEISLSTALHIDFAMICLMYSTSLESAMIHERGDTEDRISKSGEVKGNRKEERKREILKAYNNLNKDKRLRDLSANRIALLIQQEAKSQINLLTIKRYLKEENIEKFRDLKV